MATVQYIDGYIQVLTYMGGRGGVQEWYGSGFAYGAVWAFTCYPFTVGGVPNTQATSVSSFVREDGHGSYELHTVITNVDDPSRDLAPYVVFATVTSS